MGCRRTQIAVALDPKPLEVVPMAADTLVNSTRAGRTDTCAGSFASMPTITMGHGPIAL